jgi:biotin carboxylase
MNLLVTNTRNAQSYAIIRALRPFAKKIVATMEGDRRLAARLSHAANSRLVDKRYYTPSPEGDWRAGQIQEKNSEREAAYIEAILKLCDEEKIDTIFPSFDPHVYVFSKNKERFQQRGILIPVPDYEVVITPLDKYRTIKAAEAVGFPCPKTYLPESEDDVGRIALQLGFPLVIKPRFTAGGRGTAVVNDMSQLWNRIRPTIATQTMPLLQEYIPGNQQENIHLVLDTSGETKLVFQKKSHRQFCHGAFTVHRESIPPTPYGFLAGRFLREMGWWGAGLVELKLDERDQIPKLMEVNPRFGSGILDAVAAGLNPPRVCLTVASGEDAAIEPAKDYPVAIYLHPVEDALVFCLRFLNLVVCRLRAAVHGEPSPETLHASTGVKELIQPYRYAYFGNNPKMLDPITKLFFRDPVVVIIFWFQRFSSTFAAARALLRGLVPDIFPLPQRAHKLEHRPKTFH